MAETENLLQKIQKRMNEKDETIEELMGQLAEIEEEKDAMRVELDELRAMKTEYEKVKQQLDSLADQG